MFILTYAVMGYNNMHNVSAANSGWSDPSASVAANTPKLVFDSTSELALWEWGKRGSRTGPAMKTLRTN